MKRMVCRKIYIKITTSICTRPTIRQKGSHRVRHAACMLPLLDVVARPERNARSVHLQVLHGVYISANTGTSSRYLRGYLNCWSLGNHDYNRTQVKASTHRPLRSIEENSVASPSLVMQSSTILFLHACTVLFSSGPSAGSCARKTALQRAQCKLFVSFSFLNPRLVSRSDFCFRQRGLEGDGLAVGWWRILLR